MQGGKASVVYRESMTGIVHVFCIIRKCTVVCPGSSPDHFGSVLSTADAITLILFLQLYPPWNMVLARNLFVICLKVRLRRDTRSFHFQPLFSSCLTTSSLFLF